MHTCPDCGQACTCCGDIDDLMLDDDPDWCEHECGIDEDDEDWPYDD